MRMDLRLALLGKFGSQTAASRRLKIREEKISHIVRGHDLPNERERRLFETALGRDYFATEADGPQAV